MREGLMVEVEERLFAENVTKERGDNVTKEYK